MKAKLKEIYSLELTCPLKEYCPPKIYDFGFSVRLIIGPENNDQGESFDIFICTPDWIKHQYCEEKCVWGRHMLVVLEYDFEFIRNKIESYVASCNGSDWLQIAHKLSAIAAWEFEDYQSI